MKVSSPYIVVSGFHKALPLPILFNIFIDDISDKINVSVFLERLHIEGQNFY